MENKYQVLKIEQIEDKDNERQHNVLVWLMNRKSRKLLRFDNFKDYIHIELPGFHKWTNKNIKKLCDDLLIEDYEISEKEKYSGYSTRKYKILTVYGERRYYFDEVITDITEYIMDQLKNIGFNKKEAKREAKLIIFDRNYTLCQKFSTKTRINPGSWISIKNELPKDTPWSNLETICVENLSDLEVIIPPPIEEHPIVKIASIDFEVYSWRKGKFPDPWEPPDEVYLISLVMGAGKQRTGYLLTCHPKVTHDFIEEHGQKIPILKYVDEIEMLRGMEQLIVDEDPDMIVTFNGSGFDFPFWRVRFIRDLQELGAFGRITNYNPIFKSIDWGSSAVKNREQQVLVIPGRVVADLHTIIRRDEKYDIYTLDFISHEVLGDASAKDHLEAEDQFRIYRNGTDEEWYKLLHYSIRDSWAPLDIMEKKSTSNKLFAFANIIGINVDDVYSRGQQYRLENKLFQRLSRQGVLIDYPKEKGKRYKGATVQDPQIRLFQNVVVIDFASLYPSIMIAFNVSHDTYAGTNITEPPEELTWDDLHMIEITESGNKHYFVKKHIRVGTLCDVLRDLLEQRGIKKKLMKTEKDPVMIINLDAEQNALKIIANSGYGFMGAETGKLPLPSGAEGVTAMGRKLIAQVVDDLKELDATIVYGDTDSIMFTFPRWHEMDGPEAIKQIMKETSEIALNITKKIGTPPIEIVLDHVYADYLCVKKKCYISNELNPSDMSLHLSFKGVLMQRREHNKWTKDLYKICSLIAIGRDSWGTRTPMEERERKTREIINRELHRLITNQVPMDDLTKINQAGREAKEYAKANYPIRLLMEREEANGRPIKVGERFKWWWAEPGDDENLKEIKRGNQMRKKLEDGEKLHYEWYINVLDLPMERLLKATYQNDFYKEMSKFMINRHKLHRSIRNRPFPVPIPSKKKNAKYKKVKKF